MTMLLKATESNRYEYKQIKVHSFVYSEKRGVQIIDYLLGGF